MVIYVFFMVYRLVVACGEAGCTVVSPEKFDLLAVAGGVELVIEIKNIIGIYKRKGDK